METELNMYQAQVREYKYAIQQTDLEIAQLKSEFHTILKSRRSYRLAESPAGSEATQSQGASQGQVKSDGGFSEQPSGRQSVSVMSERTQDQMEAASVVSVTPPQQTTQPQLDNGLVKIPESIAQ